MKKPAPKLSRKDRAAGWTLSPAKAKAAKPVPVLTATATADGKLLTPWNRVQ